MTDVEKYLKELCEYILNSLNQFDIYPENVITEDRTIERYWSLNIKFDTKCLGEPLKDEDGEIFNKFLREAVSKFLESNTPPKGTGRCEIFMITAQPWNNGSITDKWKGVDTVSLSIFLRHFKTSKRK